MNLPTAVKRAFKKTPHYRLEVLMAERSKWARRQTIASNKLAAVQRSLDRLSQEMADKILNKNENQKQ